MSRFNETSSIKTVAAAVAVSAVSLSAIGTLTQQDICNQPPQIVYEGNLWVTDTVSTIDYYSRTIPVIEVAERMFGSNMRDFTSDENRRYQQALSRIYKPIGVNVFDLC